MGDFVFDGNGKPTEILKVFPQGKIDNYKISFRDGRSCYCNIEHIFKIITSNGTQKEMTVRQMIEQNFIDKRGNSKFFIPTIYNKPVEYPFKNYPIHPYTIGAFLGDGCCKEKNLTLSSQSEEIPNKICQLENIYTKREKIENGYDWYFYKSLNKEVFDKKNRNRSAIKTGEFFEDYKNNLLCYSFEKRIPSEYKYGSVEQRYSLLQGLFDTDGSICDNKYFTMRLTSTSLLLLKDVQEIIYSLGYSHLSICEDNRSNKYTNKCYNLYVYGGKQKWQKD